MAVIGMDVYDNGLPPAEQEVAGRRADDDGQAEPRVERHHDQHQKVSKSELKEEKRIYINQSLILTTF